MKAAAGRDEEEPRAHKKKNHKETMLLTENSCHVPKLYAPI